MEFVASRVETMVSEGQIEVARALITDEIKAVMEKKVPHMVSKASIQQNCRELGNVGVLWDARRPQSAIISGSSVSNFCQGFVTGQ